MRLSLMRMAAAVLPLVYAEPAFAEAMKFTISHNGGNCVGCMWTAAEGEITKDTPEAFRQYLLDHDYVKYISLNSPGGDLLAGIELGRLFREIGAHVTVAHTYSWSDGQSEYEMTKAGVCASACVFAFMGGVERSLGDTALRETYDSVVGVHQFFSANDSSIDSEAIQIVVGLTLLHTLQMGIDPNVVFASSTTSPDDLYVFSDRELVEFGLVTTGVTQDQWQMEPVGEGLVLRSTYRFGATQAAEIEIRCRGTGGSFIITVNENVEEWSVDYLINHFRTSHSYELTLGGDSFSVLGSSTVSNNARQGKARISFLVPGGFLVSYAGQTMEINPNLPGSFDHLFEVQVDLPNSTWLSMAARNCG